MLYQYDSTYFKYDVKLDSDIQETIEILISNFGSIRDHDRQITKLEDNIMTQYLQKDINFIMKIMKIYIIYSTMIKIIIIVNNTNMKKI